MFDENGYLDIDKIVKYGKAFNFIIGGRGIGKTYGFLKYALIHKIPFIFLRKTQAQANLVSRPDFSPINPIAEDLGLQICYKKLSENHSGIFLNNEMIGLVAALSTFYNVRGFSAAWVRWVIFDEFLDESERQIIKHEWATLANVYETVNRNRELQGNEPVRLFALANSTNISNDYFVQLQIVQKLYNMQESKKDARWYTYTDDDLLVLYFKVTPIAERKQKTVLYRFARNSSFYDMAIANKFDVAAYANIKSMPLSHYKVVAHIGELYLYKSKTGLQYYISSHKSGTPAEYDLSESSIKKFMMHYDYVFMAYYDNRVTFESFVLAVLFDKYFAI